MRTVEIAEGLTAASASLHYGEIGYKADGQAEFTGASKRSPQSGDLIDSDLESKIMRGDSETQIMRGAKSATTGSVIFWRGNNNDLQRRMGELRLSHAERGIWARYLGGKMSLNEQRTNVSQRYNIVQVGYDQHVRDWMFGVAGEYGKSSVSYGNGSGTGHLGGLAVYAFHQGKRGDYFDVIGKFSNIRNEYRVFHDMGFHVEADYCTNGVSLSMEYGKRIAQPNGFYIDPSVELTMGHLAGKDYDAPSSVPGKVLHVQQDAVHSTVARLGIGIGQETEKSNIFLKLALAHEFAGKIKNTYSATGEPTSTTEIDLKDTWLDIELGGSCKISDNAYVYGTLTKDFGATLKNDWRADVGVRFSF